MPDSPRLEPGVNRFTHPLLRPKAKPEETPTDWVKIAAIAAAILGGVIAGLGVCCFMDYFPTSLLGGPLGTGITVITGLTILLPAALVLLSKWKPEYYTAFCG